MRKYDVGTAAIVYIIWCVMSYFISSFYVWQWNPGMWSQEQRDVMTMFGPIFGIFVFLAVMFWDEAFKQENHGNE